MIGKLMRIHSRKRKNNYRIQNNDLIIKMIMNKNYIYQIQENIEKNI